MHGALLASSVAFRSPRLVSMVTATVPEYAAVSAGGLTSRTPPTDSG